MSSKDKPPPKPPATATPPTPKPPLTPEQVLAAAPLDVLMEALAKISGQLQGKVGEELHDHVAEVKGQVETLVGHLEDEQEDLASRQVIAGEVDKLIDAVARTNTAAGDAIGQHRAPIAQAFAGVDLDRMADGLRVLSDWLQDPTDDKAAHIQLLVDQLQAAMGSIVGYDPERAEAARRAEIKRDVAASLDQIFRGKAKPS